MYWVGAVRGYSMRVNAVFLGVRLRSMRQVRPGDYASDIGNRV